MKNTFHNADEAYEALLNEVVTNGIDFDNTQAIFNCGFYILNPEDNHIKNKQRNWVLSPRTDLILSYLILSYLILSK